MLDMAGIYSTTNAALSEEDWPIPLEREYKGIDNCGFVVY